MRIRTFQVVGLIALAGGLLHGQTGPTYYATKPMDCTGVGGPVDVVDVSGAKVGFSCFVSGTFTWYAAGGAWTTAIRVAVPETGDVGIDYSFFDTTGTKVSVDTIYGSSPFINSSNELKFYVAANQPAEVNLLGSTTDGPDYPSIASGTVSAAFYCPNAATCSNLLPQLVYSALPTVPWSLSAPIAWDTAPITTRWAAEGIDDGGQHKVSFVIYNQGIHQSADFVLTVYDSKGVLVGSGTTRSIPCLPLLASGFYGEAGTYGDLVSNVIHKQLPSGLFKLIIDGGPSAPSSVQVLQFTGTSATALQVFNAGPIAAGDRLLGNWNTRVSTAPVGVFQQLP